MDINTSANSLPTSQAVQDLAKEGVMSPLDATQLESLTTTPVESQQDAEKAKKILDSVVDNVTAQEDKTPSLREAKSFKLDGETINPHDESQLLSALTNESFYKQFPKQTKLSLEGDKHILSLSLPSNHHRRNSIINVFIRVFRSILNTFGVKHSLKELQVDRFLGKFEITIDANAKIHADKIEADQTPPEEITAEADSTATDSTAIKGDDKGNTTSTPEPNINIFDLIKEKQTPEGGTKPIPLPEGTPSEELISPAVPGSENADPLPAEAPSIEGSGNPTLDDKKAGGNDEDGEAGVKGNNTPPEPDLELKQAGLTDPIEPPVAEKLPDAEEEFADASSSITKTGDSQSREPVADKNADGLPSRETGLGTNVDELPAGEQGSDPNIDGNLPPPPPRLLKDEANPEKTVDDNPPADPQNPPTSDG